LPLLKFQPSYNPGIVRLERSAGALSGSRVVTDGRTDGMSDYNRRSAGTLECLNITCTRGRL